MLHVWTEGRSEMCDGYEESGRMSTILFFLSLFPGRVCPVTSGGGKGVLACEGSFEIWEGREACQGKNKKVTKGQFGSLENSNKGRLERSLRCKMFSLQWYIFLEHQNLTGLVLMHQRLLRSAISCKEPR
jgi:hypothetical protein